MILDRGRLEHLRWLQENDRPPPWEPLPHQVAPDGEWFFWLNEAGRGAGKTATASHYVQDHLDGPPCISKALPHRVALIAPTIGDAIESANLTDMALTRLEPESTFTQSGGGSMVKWPNGSQVRLFGTHTKEDVNRLRAGGNRCLVWAEELASWRHLEDAWIHMMFGLRLGPNPQIIGTTTPKARPVYVKVRKQADHISNATTLDNPNLNPEQKQRLIDLYDGTSIGAQEIYGKLIEEAEGAIWTFESIETDRVDEAPGKLGRIVVAVDPPGGATEAGIVAAAEIPKCKCGGKRLPHYAVLSDVSGKLSPEGWGARSVGLYDDLGGSRIVGESNYGGDMVEAVIRNVDPSVSFKMVHASRGKRIRAEPIFALYEQHRVHHIGTFPALESEQATWEPDESEWSPNRLDALVWSLTELSGRREWRVG